MKPVLHIWPEEKKWENDTCVTSATIEIPPNQRFQVWYKIPLIFQEAITENQDPFVLSTLFMAMQKYSSMRVHGCVSPSLLSNLCEFQEAWSAWLPKRYSAVRIITDQEKEVVKKKRDVTNGIAAFSGGVDSCFTVWRHRPDQKSVRRSNILAGVMVHGLDIPLSETEMFKAAALKSSAMLKNLGMDCIPVCTNFREIKCFWSDSHGAGVASCLSLLAGRYDVGYIASSSPYTRMTLPWGSNPITDRLMSSKTFSIVHDGAAFIRREKLREISKWPAALENLRVCWEGREHDRNCCSCEKCIRTILGFRVMGIELPRSFPTDVTDEQILSLRGLKGTPLYYFEEIHSLATKKGIKASWVHALQKCIKENRIIADRNEMRGGQRVKKFIKSFLR
jgi:hypothetical protein